MIIKCFGIARDIFERDEIIINDPNLVTVADLRSHLNESNKHMKTINSYFIAVNQEYADDNQLITSADEIAIIPPVSGG